MKNYSWYLKQLKEGLASSPIDTGRISEINKDRQMLRYSIEAELDATNLYEQMADNTDNEIMKKVFLDIAREEKTHIGEFQELLIRLDKQHEEELKKGSEEVNEIEKE